MITFLQYFEEAAKPRELVYHITDGNNLKSILSQGLIPNKLSNFEDVSSDIAQSKRSILETVQDAVDYYGED